MGCERVINQVNRKQTTNNDDKSAQGPRAECPKCNPARLRDKCTDYWLDGGKWLLGFWGQGGIPINLLYHFCQTYWLPNMSCSTLHNGAPFEFLSGCVSEETITPCDCCNFPCAWADSCIAYPSNTEVAKPILFAFVCKTDWLSRSGCAWPTAMFVWNGLSPVRLSGDLIHWQTTIIWMPCGGSQSVLGNSAICQCQMIWRILSFGVCLRWDSTETTLDVIWLMSFLDGDLQLEGAWCPSSSGNTLHVA